MLSHCSRRSFFLSAGGLLFTSGAGGTQQGPTFSADVNLVNLLAVVRDEHGRFVKDLPESDFLLEEDGRPQKIRNFSQESNLPLTLGLLLDTSASMTRVLDDEREAAHAFLKDVLRPEEDRAFVLQFDSGVNEITTLTSSRRKLDQGLGTISAEAVLARRRTTPHTGASTVLYDALRLATSRTMAPLQGRKAVILLSDGMDAGSRASLAEAIDSAQGADTLVYTIHIYAEPPDAALLPPKTRAKITESLAQGKKVLERISFETGAASYESAKGQRLKEIFNGIQDELRNQYSMSYSPTPRDATPGFRKIGLKTRQNFAVQTRAGYFVGR
jgi:VWFA-related protein